MKHCDKLTEDEQFFLSENNTDQIADLSNDRLWECLKLVNALRDKLIRGLAVIKD